MVCPALKITICACPGSRFVLDEGPTQDDNVFDFDGAKLLVDSVSYHFVRGATVDFADELIKSTFEASK